SAGRAPELALAAARVRSAEGQARAARAAGVPDLFPQVGLRRTQAFSGLFLGLGLDLPVFNRGSGLRRYAAGEVEAARLEAAATERLVASAEAGATSAAARLDAAASAFGDDWRRDLDRTVTSAEARFTAGEGTLAELLDARRARLRALDEFELWRLDRRRARAEAARAAGAEPDAQALCDGPIPTESESR
ncbi:MAG: TolC family protein, partial [Gemmatimonadales bacterium]|nr:TolC family protein [Gemmatimonadales bacterium]